MDIIGCRFEEVMDQKKKHMARVSDLYRERERSIKTVLFFIVSASLLSGETVPTYWLGDSHGALFASLIRLHSPCIPIRYT